MSTKLTKTSAYKQQPHFESANAQLLNTDALELLTFSPAAILRTTGKSSYTIVMLIHNPSLCDHFKKIHVSHKHLLIDQTIK